MKRILAMALVLTMALSLCMLAGCNNDGTTKVDPNKNIYEDFEDFESYVPKDSDIIGTWIMTSPDTNQEWQFFANTTLHQTTITGDVRATNVCTYNYDGEGNLKFYSFNHKDETAYTVTIENSILTLVDEAEAKITFEKK